MAPLIPPTCTPFHLAGIVYFLSTARGRRILDDNPAEPEAPASSPAKQ